MGILADSFRARINEMKARHEQTDRELTAAREEVLKALAKMQDAADGLNN